MACLDLKQIRLYRRDEEEGMCVSFNSRLLTNVMLLREVRGGERERQTIFSLNGSELRLWCWYLPFSLMKGTFYLNIMVARKQNKSLASCLSAFPSSLWDDVVHTHGGSRSLVSIGNTLPDAPSCFPNTPGASQSMDNQN